MSEWLLSLCVRFSERARTERGATTLEYVLLVSAVGAAVLVAATQFGEQLKNAFAALGDLLGGS